MTGQTRTGFSLGEEYIRQLLVISLWKSFFLSRFQAAARASFLGCTVVKCIC